MIKKNQLISGALFSVFVVLQLFAQKYVWEKAAITNITISMLIETIAILAFAGVAIYLLCFEADEAKKKMIAFSGILYIIFVGLYFSVHQSMAIMCLINMGNLAESDAAMYAVIAVKVLLMAAAVVFLLFGEKKETQEVSDTEQGLPTQEQEPVLEPEQPTPQPVAEEEKTEQEQENEQE